MTAPINTASFYADFKSLAALKREARADSQQALRAAAQQFESLFTDMMLKSMRAASFGDAMTGSDTVDMYQGMADQQLAMQLSKGKGFGLADMLVQQLSRANVAPGEIASTATAGPQAAQGATTSGVTDRRELIQMVAAVFDGDAALPVLPPTAELPQLNISDAKQQHAWPPATPEEFVQRLLPHAQRAAQQLGVDPSTLVAHAALETGWGKHMPSHSDGSNSFNLFGIKATQSWSGQSVGGATLEYEQGVAVKRVERFKAYDSLSECFDDYAKLLSGSSRYTGARNSGANTHQFAESLQQGGYATDPMYANKLRAVAGIVRTLQTAPAQVALNPADT